jgi:hypothetical protein
MVPQLGMLLPGKAKRLCGGTDVRPGSGPAGRPNSAGPIAWPGQAEAQPLRRQVTTATPARLDFRVPEGAVEGFADAMSTGGIVSIASRRSDQLGEGGPPRAMPLKRALFTIALLMSGAMISEATSCAASTTVS